MVTSALWSDVDGDGWPDLLLTLEWGSVRYFHNNKGTGFEDWTERAGFAAAGTGWWTSIASADFNGDGRPDFVVGNVGPEHAVPREPGSPALLYYGDFRGDGEEPQIVEAYYEGGRLYPLAQPQGPWRGHPLRAQALPQEQRLCARHARRDPRRRQAGSPRPGASPRRSSGAACS
jgi:hypothetical protein